MTLLSYSRIQQFLLTFFLCGSCLLAQSTNIDIGNTVQQPSVKRFGMNLGTLTFYDSGQTTQNIVVQNSGFEGQIWNSTIRCMGGTATSCIDEDIYSGWPAGFWNGATYEVFYGASAGRTGTITYSTAVGSGGSGQGITLNFNNSGVAPAAGDYLIVRMTIPGGSSQGWWPATSGAGTITDNFTDLPPGTLGKQTAVLTAPGASDVATISGFFDSLSGKTFIQLNGTYQVQFKAKGTGGSNQVNVQVYRAGVATYMNEPVTLTNSWNTYNLTFNAAENGYAVGTGGVAFSTVGADSFELDDVSLTKLNGDPTNTTVFRDPVVNALRLLQPGIIRYWGGQLGDTLDNLLTPQFGRQRSGYLAWYTESDAIDYGLHEFLALCQTVGAEPWFVVPSTFSTTDASNLIEYLAGDSTTTYGAKRTALGQATPWTAVFSKIHLEFGNEAWNGTFKGGSIEYSAPYGSRAQTIFGIMRAHPLFTAANYDLILGGQAAYPARNTDIQNNCNNNDSFTVAPYTMGTVDSYSDNESLFGPTFAEPEAFMSSNGTAEGLTPGMVYQDYQAIQASSRVVPLSFYETNMGTLSGSITQDALNSYVPSLGAGLMVADTMLQGLRTFGVVNQNLFALPQYDFVRPDGETALLWGSVLDMGVTDRKRPQFLALQLANTALSNGATMLQTVHSGADPTWDQALVNTVQISGAHYLQSYAFQQGANHSLVVFNLSRTSALPVTFSGVNAPSGTVQMQQLTSTNLTDTNENSNLVSISAPATLNNFSGAAGLTLPQYSMTVLTWSGSATPDPAPVITAISASGLTSTSATITWTTDQPSSSQVQYGTSTSYGSTSTLDPTLTTSHTVTLSGLTPGTLYDFAVVSANSSGTSSISTNSTFTTGNGTPVISNVSATGITGTSATITWTTDQPTSSLVNYGTTIAYGFSSTLDPTLVTSHSVILTGLTAGIAYNFDVVSSNSANSTATSPNATFYTTTTPVAAPPVISNVSVAGITSTTATITWTTDQPTSSLVNYGTTTAYGSSSTLDPTLVTSHSVTLTGLTANTAYNFDVVSANSGNTSTTSANNTFSTLASSAPAPYVGYVAFWGVTDSGVTISWSTDQLANTELAYGTTKALGQFTSVQPALTASHGVVLTGLKSGTTYYFVAESTAADGVTGYSSTYSFTTTGSAATPAPVISNVTATNLTSTSATITWTTDEVATDSVAYGTSSAYGLTSAQGTAFVTSHSVVLTGLTPGTTYDYAVSSANSSGVSSTSSNYTFATTTPAAPVISAVTVTAITSTSATVTWTTDQSASSLVNYGTTTSYGSASTLDTTMVTSHSVILTGLTTGTTYDFDVVAANSYGTSATSANYTFATPAVAQTPVISNVVATSLTNTSATITWTTDQPTSSQVNYGTTTSYGLSSVPDPTLVTTHSVILTGLTPGTTYEFSVVSTNSSGMSASSPNSSFATTALAGPPGISNVTANAMTSTSATISWTTDQASTSLVNYGSSTAYGSSSALDTNLVTSHSVILTGLAPGTAYDFAVVSANSANISATSPNYTFATVSATANPPNVSYVASWGVTASGITISWSTDVPANTAVAYGTTSSLGQVSPVQTALTVSHGVTLTGLTSGTTYYFVAQSTGANGATGYSTTYTFTTESSVGPTISGIVVTPGVNNQAQITWQTSTPAYSYVQFGLTTTYDKWSERTGLTVNPQPAMGWVPSGVIHYQLISTDANGLQTVSPDYTFIEP